MARWSPDARQLLRQAALDLFLERGYAATRVADVAARAGLTERTFFRHFTDKREVLFSEDDALLEALLGGVDAAPGSAAAVDAAAAGAHALATVLQGEREALRRRQQVIDSEPELRERDAAKQARWVLCIAERLEGRGHPRLEAALAAEVVGGCLRTAYREWLRDRAPAGLPTRLSALLDRLPQLVAGRPAG